MGKPEKMRPRIRSKSRWWDNIKIDIQEVERVTVDGIDLAVDTERWLTLSNAVMKLRVP